MPTRLLAVSGLLLSACATIAAPDTLPSCAAIRAAAEQSLNVSLGFRAREPGRLVTVRFEDYPPFTIIASEAIAADLESHAEAKRYRTTIRLGAERGAAFAGHLAVAEWACGTGCQQFAFIDARNGDVIWGPQAQYGAAYRLDSRLFVVNPPESPPRDAAGPPIDVPAATRAFLWDGEALVPLD